jgi:hypothetical protein
MVTLIFFEGGALRACSLEQSADLDALVGGARPRPGILVESTNDGGFEWCEITYRVLTLGGEARYVIYTGGYYATYMVV